MDKAFRKDSHNGISIQSETSESLDLVKDVVVKDVVKCKAIAKSNCDWEAVWFGYCHVPCKILLILK